MWSRGLPTLCRTIPCRQFSVAAQSGAGPAEIDDFLHSIAAAPTQKLVKNRTVLETSTEFFKWLEQNPIKSIDQFITAAQMAITVKSTEQNKAFSKIDDIAKKVLPKFYENFGPKETVDALRFVLQLNSKGKVSTDIQNLFLEKKISQSDLQTVPFDTLVMIIRYSKSSIDQNVIESIATSLISRIEKELANPADLLAILAGDGYEKSKWFHNEAFLKKAERLVAVMGMAEKCALLKHMAVNKQRNRQLLGAIINAISSSSQVLTVSQIVSVTGSCSALTYYPPKIARKISNDLEKNSNVLAQWDDVLSIADSFIRMRMGDQKSWNLLVRWAIENVKQAHPARLSKFVSGLARIGEPSGKPLAKALKPFLVKEKASTPNNWLNIVFSLAYFQELEAVHADSVLNKSFVDQIMNSTMEIHDRLRKAMTLLMISSAAKVDMQGKYEGPTVNKETFARFGINFDAKTIRNARQLKYSSNHSECDRYFLKSLFKLAPQDTHCQLPNVEDCGAFVDAYVMPDPNSNLLVNTSQWGSKKPRPLFFYGWLQTKQNTETSGEINTVGQEQLGLRLMRSAGFDPVVVFKTELDYCSTEIDQVNLLRDKIHKKN
ncbi:RAP domain-containing protein [Caenorhabditis elegans]|uniref:RAP domain-containing protein n=2 Tax=Caenorhabditis elegans TaxID=6239 RepID=Q17532_CAEEL|nr:RAP domain-containing protein [Caenorhabditis elegans]CAA97769.2 RAP domain-containing protein [Caenorhabditis elegans]|eukprot:NP_502521.2 Uncharacterized protein CELE_B0564.7 [Caenorhabditis elegans]